MGVLRSFFDRHSIFWLSIIVIVSTYIKFAYTFYMTGYHNYLYGEMGQLWQMATESFYKGDIEPSQWMIWPPVAHIALAWIFKILYLFDLYQYKLEVVLGINIILSSISVIMVYAIALRLMSSRFYGLIVAFVYAFFFQLIYFNAFVLIENPAIFLYIFSITVLLYGHKDPLRVFISGILLGFAVSFKPAWILSIIPLLGYLLFESGEIKANLRSSLSVFAGFATVLFLVIVNNYAISTGKLKTLSTNEGIEYYISSCGKYGVTYDLNGSSQSYISQIAQRTPELGIAKTIKPFYERSFFYKKGGECEHGKKYEIKQHVDNLSHLFGGAMFPMASSAEWAPKLLAIFDKVAIWLTIMLLFALLLYFDDNISKSTLSLLLTLVLAQMLPLDHLYIQQRDLYGIFFIVVMLGIIPFFSFANTLKRIWWVWIIFSIFVIAANIELFNTDTNSDPKKIAVSLVQNNAKINDLDQERDINHTQIINASTVDFDGQYALGHKDLGEFDFGRDFFMDMRVGIELDQDVNMSFEIVSDDGYRLSIDKEKLIANTDTKDISLDKVNKLLTKGRHRIDISYFQSDGMMTFRVYCVTNGKRYLLGDGDGGVKYVKFFYLKKDEYYQPKKRKKARIKKHIKTKKLQKSKRSSPKIRRHKKTHHSK